MKDRFVGDGALAGHDVELGSREVPPRLGNSAIRHKAFMNDVAVFGALGPKALEIKRIAGGQQAGTRNDLRDGGAPEIVKETRLGIHVVVPVVTFELRPIEEVLVADVSTEIGFAGFLV